MPSSVINVVFEVSDKFLVRYGVAKTSRAPVSGGVRRCRSASSACRRRRQA
jgi:hypothetical protein